MRFTPLKQKGRHGVAMEGIRRRVWPEVLRRAHQRCEACGARDRTLQWSHIYGRRGTGAGLGDWADLEDLTAALCASAKGELGCHDKLDRHLDELLSFRLSWDAIKRLAATTGFNLDHHRVGPQTFSPIDAIRYLVRTLEATGWSVDPETITPRRAT